jgi:hypothetical protein
MCCKAERQHAFGNCGSQRGHFPGCGMGHGPQFLSKKKKIQLLKEQADELRERAKDIDDYIDELKEKK